MFKEMKNIFKLNGAATKFPDMHDLSNLSRIDLRFGCENFDLNLKLVGT